MGHSLNIQYPAMIWEKVFDFLSSPCQNGWHSAGDISKSNFLAEHFRILIEIPPTLVPTNNNSVLIHVAANFNGCIVKALKFGNGNVIPPHTLLGVWLFIHGGIKVNASKGAIGSFTGGE